MGRGAGGLRARGIPERPALPGSPRGSGDPSAGALDHLEPGTEVCESRYMFLHLDILPPPPLISFLSLLSWQLALWEQ